ncbi:caspase recruitment domain-containing protein 14-like [Clupea harengus]|uniref:Caspase recruitment domain-containing protein 14-like n=1 Tax=Clupea harengus TaxID=7950 RepID=A0A6P8F680_CLUHA|nr:caspase recruitment domain-containing protein 14-like [Clupea harengus]
MEAETFSPAREDILAQDLEEAQDRRSELADQLTNLREENERLAREAEELFEEKENLSLQVQKLKLDCEMYQQKSTVFQSQLGELQAERDRAYLSRDDAQAQIACNLAEKDVLRSQLVELQEKVFNLRARSAESGPRDKPRAREYSWESSYLGSSSEGPPPSPQPRSRLCRMNAICPDFMRSDDLEFTEGGLSSLRSSHVEPPGIDSLRRRQLDLSSDYSLETDDSPFSLDTESDFVMIFKDKAMSASLPTLPQKISSPDTVSRASAPPFLMRSRPQALRITGRVLTLTVQDGTLLGQIQVVGGNKTGVFVHGVTQDSSAHAAGVSPGAQILEVKYEQERQALQMVLEDSTQEEALWALGQVKGPCQLILRPNQDGSPLFPPYCHAPPMTLSSEQLNEAYDGLLQQLKTGEVTSGDSFYVRVNMSVPAGVAAGAPLHQVQRTFWHVTNTCHGTKGTCGPALVHPASCWT